MYSYFKVRDGFDLKLSDRTIGCFHRVCVFMSVYLAVHLHMFKAKIQMQEVGKL